MKRTKTLIAATVVAAGTAMAADVADSIEGTVKKVDKGAKTAVVATTGGAERTFHYTDQTVVRGATDAKHDGGEAVGGLTDGADVAVHYTKKGTKDVATEFDSLGKDGLKSTEGTVSHLDRKAKTLTIKTADGADQTFHMSEHAVRDTGKDLDKGADKSAKVTVYYAEEGGKKTAHFFRKIT